MYSYALCVSLSYFFFLLLWMQLNFRDSCTYFMWHSDQVRSNLSTNLSVHFVVSMVQMWMWICIAKERYGISFSQGITSMLVGIIVDTVEEIGHTDIDCVFDASFNKRDIDFIFFRSVCSLKSPFCVISARVQCSWESCVFITGLSSIYSHSVPIHLSAWPISHWKKHIKLMSKLAKLRWKRWTWMLKGCGFLKLCRDKTLPSAVS